MNYLVTGITGFAGPHLTNLLHKEGHKVFGLVRGSNGMETDILDVVPAETFNDITFVYGNLTSYNALQRVFKKNRFDGVFHLAAQSHPPTSFEDPLDTLNNNVMGTANLIQCITEMQPECKLMFCSTSEVYGNTGKDGRKITIDNKILPSNPYGVSKASIDLYVQERVTNGKLNAYITRAFSHTGPRRGKKFSISSDAYQIARMVNGQQDKELLIGNLDSVRVVVDVRDIVNAYYLLMINNKSTGGIFNVCGDEPHKMRYFTDLLVEVSGLEGVEYKIHDPFWRPIDIHYQDGDRKELVELTGWKPEYDIRTTMVDLLDYWVKKTSE